MMLASSHGWLLTLLLTVLQLRVTPRKDPAMLLYVPSAGEGKPMRVIMLTHHNIVTVIALCEGGVSATLLLPHTHNIGGGGLARRCVHVRLLPRMPPCGRLRHCWATATSLAIDPSSMQQTRWVGLCLVVRGATSPSRSEST